MATKSSVKSPAFPCVSSDLQSWGWVLDSILNTLRDRLDVWKLTGLLLNSLNVKYFVPRLQGPSLYSFERGRRLFARTMQELLSYSPKKNGSLFATPQLQAMVQACCLTDENLAHVFQLLGLFDLLENAPAIISKRHQAQMLIAVIGELDNVGGCLKGPQSKAIVGEKANDAVGNTEEERAKTGKLLQETAFQICELCVETGRDSVAHSRNLATRLSFVPRFDHNRTKEEDHWTSGRRLGSALYAYQMGRDVDLPLECLLLSGSVVHIWQRMMYLHSRSTSRFPMEPKIAATVEMAAPLMNRFRQLLFTRFLVALVNPTALFENPNSQTTAKRTSLIRIVVEAFLKATLHADEHVYGTSNLVESGCWPYESEEQLREISKSPFLDQHAIDSLRKVICIPDSMHWVEDDVFDYDIDLQYLETGTVPKGSRSLEKFQDAVHEQYKYILNFLQIE